MNGYVILKESRQIIGYVPDVVTATSTSLIGANSSMTGIDESLASVIVTDAVIENLFDSEGNMLEVTMSDELIDAALPFRKKEKVEQLNMLCEQSILAGFHSETTGHFYAFGERDQLNFTQQMILMMNRPDIQEVLWKAEDAGPIQHSREEFLAVVAEAEAHKRSKMQRYWELKAQVQAAKTNEEIDAITWEVTDETAAV